MKIRTKLVYDVMFSTKTDTAEWRKAQHAAHVADRLFTHIVAGDLEK